MEAIWYFTIKIRILLHKQRGQCSSMVAHQLSILGAVVQILSEEKNYPTFFELRSNNCHLLLNYFLIYFMYESVHVWLSITLNNLILPFPSFLLPSVVCCCKLNNTQVCDEHLFEQGSTCTGYDQLPIFCCTKVHLGRHTRLLIYTLHPLIAIVERFKSYVKTLEFA